MCAPNNINSINLQYSMRDPGVPFIGGFSFDEHVLLKLVFFIICRTLLFKNIPCLSVKWK